MIRLVKVKGSVWEHREGRYIVTGYAASSIVPTGIQRDRYFGVSRLLAGGLRQRLI